MATSPQVVAEFVGEITDLAQRFCGLQVLSFSIDVVTNKQTLVVVDEAKSGPATADKLKNLLERLYGCHAQRYTLSLEDEVVPHTHLYLTTQFQPW